MFPPPPPLDPLQPIPLPVATLIAELSRLQLDQKALCLHLLTRLAEIVPSYGPCSYLRFNRFFSDYDEHNKRGRLVEPPLHINPPDAETVRKWDERTRKPKNPFETTIYESYGDWEYGGILLKMLRREKTWRDKLANESVRIFVRLMKQEDVVDIAYMFIHCAEDDLWVISLRRRSTEPAFTDADRDLLHLVAQTLHRTRSLWYCQDLKQLTPMERAVVAVMASDGYSAEKAAAQIESQSGKREFWSEEPVDGISPNTYRGHQGRIYKKLGVTSELELMACLNRLPRQKSV